MPPFSAIVITFNEERDLPRSLASLRGLADEIVVVDSQSTDHTVAVAQSAGAQVKVRAFTDFGDQKNYACSLAAHDWVLVIDADEVLSDELRASLAAWKTCLPEHNAYQIARRTCYLGGWIRHSGWYPEYSARLHRRDRARFSGSIHEAIIVDGPVGRLSGDLLHYSIGTLAEHYAKQDAFTTRAAEQLYVSGKRRWRAAMFLAAPWAFCMRFLVQLGFLDGRRGVLIAWTSARYVWLKYRKLGILARGGSLRQRAWPQAGDV